MKDTKFIHYVKLTVRKKKHIVSVSKRSAISYEEPYEGKQRADIRICKTPQLRECQSRDLY